MVERKYMIFNILIVMQKVNFRLTRLNELKNQLKIRYCEFTIRNSSKFYPKVFKCFWGRGRSWPHEFLIHL